MAARVAVITGASRGIGLAVAESLAETGTSLCLCSRSLDELTRATRSLATKTQVVCFQTDVSRREDVEALFARCRRDLGPVDWLVNNAAVLTVAPLASLAEAEWDGMIGVNLKGPFLCTQAALPDLILRRGRIVNVSSISSTLGTPRLSPYNASKWGLNGLTLSWAEELKADGVFVSAVLPGSVDTEMLEKSGFPPDMQPGDIAKIVRFLLAEAPFAMTGSLVPAFG